MHVPPQKMEENRMPIFNFKCEKCGAEKEELVFKKDEKIKCDKCNSIMKKIMSVPGKPVIR